jgi:predicted transcriptional regulator
MASVIDVKQLTKKEQFELVMEILQINQELKKELDKVISNEGDDISMTYIEKLIDQDFERYDEVFRRLA